MNVENVKRNQIRHNWQKEIRSKARQLVTCESTHQPPNYMTKENDSLSSISAYCVTFIIEWNTWKSCENSHKDYENRIAFITLRLRGGTWPIIQLNEENRGEIVIMHAERLEKKRFTIASERWWFSNAKNMCTHTHTHTEWGLSRQLTIRKLVKSVTSWTFCE